MSHPVRAVVSILALLALALTATAPAVAAGPTEVDLSKYRLEARHSLPSPLKPPAGGLPAGSLLAEEASAVTYDPDTDSLFVVGDHGTSVVRVSKTGQYLDSMTLPAGSSSQGTEFYDTEGITYVGKDASNRPRLVFTEERNRTLVEFSYVPGGTLQRANARTVKLGATIGNIGLEGLTFDPRTTAATEGFIVVKEKDPRSIFQTNVDWAAGTATNTTPNGAGATTDLFPNANAGLSDFSDAYALANVPSLAADTTWRDRLLMISQESGRVIAVGRDGTVHSRLDLISAAGNPLSIQDQTHEGVTMDADGKLYVANEQGGGVNDPQLWVYAPTTDPNTVPTGVSISPTTATLPDSTSTANAPVRLANIVVTDPDGIGTNQYSVSDPARFHADSTGLYLKQGATLDGIASPTLPVTVTVSDPTATNFVDPATSDVSATFTLNVTHITPSTGGAGRLIVSEVAPWGSGATTYKADWFELTNTGVGTIDLAGWKVDDSSRAFANAGALTGVGSVRPGESVIFLEYNAGDQAGRTPQQMIDAWIAEWFPGGAPAGLKVGTYQGGGLGLSTGGDEVNIFDEDGAWVTGVGFGSSTTNVTFENSAGIGANVAPPPVITKLSASGEDAGAWTTAGGQVGSPARADILPTVAVTEVTPFGSGNSAYKADWIELTNYGVNAVDLAGWKMDDNSFSTGNAVTLNGVASIAPGESVIFMEFNQGDQGAGLTAQSMIETFRTAWYPGGAPAGLKIGTYQGSGVGLSTGGDGVVIFEGESRVVSKVSFGASTSQSFVNPDLAGAASATAAPLTGKSLAGAAGAWTNAIPEVGSPGAIDTDVSVTEIHPTGSGNTTYKADWFELRNTGRTPVQLSGWKVDDSSNNVAAGAALTPAGSSDLLPPGRSLVFAEVNTGDQGAGSTPATLSAAFTGAWFGATAPSDFRFGTYQGGGLGLSSGGDAVNVFDAAQARVASVTFGASTAGTTFDTASGTPTVSVRGVDGAFASKAGGELGSPGTVDADTTPPELEVTGNTGTYAFGEQVDIACAATDDEPYASGVKEDCEGISGVASSFGVGERTVQVKATDWAGNTTTKDVTFTVRAAPVPPSGDTPPASGDTPPAGGGAPPVGAGTPPVGPPTPPQTGGGAPKPTTPKLGSLASRISAARLTRGVRTTLTRAKPGSRVTASVRYQGRTLRTFRGTVSKAGRATVTIRLSKAQARRLRGKTVALRYGVVGGDGRTRTITKALKIT